ncbi:MAG: DNA topoisomerase I [Candidatus Parvarchaeota archaeon]|nr:DNA topoisomerase I [Candidatus Jingweiarchaeum tengchongense]MCW1298368.1 DNA topoisomerase I [Candidatus Jingweiarchaeum tengchongense]MCW1300330.1 DNA topoisomerase I [Candidatus Jingweiarchaeum tengchongense]MCW1304873.1 DNA topoisomerase I [Candidatus Jingweiarchaeum tengchongense]MCW1305826.1 DNA topoisomerase I [Candidatus Jingweiarchaeum tengchongense]
MKLIIAEKALAGESIAKILSGNKAKKKEIKNVPIWEWDDGNTKVVVIPLRGHVITVDFSKEFKNWQKTDLNQLIDAKIVYYPSKNAIDNIKLLKEYGKNAKEMIIATDFDVEGECIGLEAVNIVREVNPNIKVKRAIFSAITKGDLDKAFSELKDLNINMAESANARREVDLIWGATLTRFISLASQRMGNAFLSVGRCQSPMLALIVNREKERMKFKPKEFWMISAILRKGKDGFIASYEKPKLFDKKKVDQILSIKTKEAKVLKVIKKIRKSNPPTPFNTTDFLRAASALGFSAPNAIRIAQQLYMSGYCSYPRTDSQAYFPTQNLREIVEKLAKSKEKFGAYAAKLLKKEKLVPTAGKAAKDHPPIHPVELADRSKLKADEWKIYELIVRRFLANLSDPSKENVIRATIDIGGEKFIAKGLKIIEPGWRDIYIYSKLEETYLPEIEEGEKLEFVRFESKKDQTKPPERYGHGGIIKKMEELGIGTKSTRPELLQKLMQRGYISKGSSLIPHPVAIAVTEILEKYVESITKPDMTADLEKEMSLVEEGKKDKKDVVEKSRKMLKNILKEVIPKKETIGKKIKEALRLQRVIGKCPNCGGDLKQLFSVKTKKRFVGCSNYPKCKTGYPLPMTGLIERTESVCDKCKTPIILVIRKGKRPFKMCLDPKCPSKANWGEKKQS